MHAAFRACTQSDGRINSGAVSAARETAGRESSSGSTSKSSMRRAERGGSLTHSAKGAASYSYSISSGATQGMDSVGMRKPMGESPGDRIRRSGRGNHN